jgi:acylphosphatase
MESGRARVLISGRVQGVGFRFELRDRAASAGLSGWVRNLADGRVEAVVEGPREHVERVIRWCHRGPDGAWVRQVQVEWEPAAGDFAGFEIERTFRSA